MPATIILFDIAITLTPQRRYSNVRQT